MTKNQKRIQGLGYITSPVSCRNARFRYEGRFLHDVIPIPMTGINLFLPFFQR